MKWCYIMEVGYLVTTRVFLSHEKLEAYVFDTGLVLFGWSTSYLQPVQKSKSNPVQENCQSEYSSDYNYLLIISMLLYYMPSGPTEYSIMIYHSWQQMQLLLLWYRKLATYWKVDLHCKMYTAVIMVSGDIGLVSRT